MNKLFFLAALTGVSVMCSFFAWADESNDVFLTDENFSVEGAVAVDEVASEREGSNSPEDDFLADVEVQPLNLESDITLIDSGGVNLEEGVLVPDDESGEQQEQRLQEDFSSIDADVQRLKQDVVEINRDLDLIQADMIAPIGSQISVFVSLDEGVEFKPQSVQLKIDDAPVSNHLYSSEEIDALVRGGVQRLYVGNLLKGRHELVAIIAGKGVNDRQYRRGARLTVEKKNNPKFVEFVISSGENRIHPVFTAKEW